MCMSINACSVSDHPCAKADADIPSIRVLLFCAAHARVCRPQVDGVDIKSYTNQQAVELLRHTGQTVHLKLVRQGFRPEDTLLPIMPVTTETKPRREGVDMDSMRGNRNINQICK